MGINRNTATLWSKDFVCITLGTLLTAVSFYFLVSLLPFYLSDMGATPGEVGVILSLFTVTALLMRPFVGYRLDINRRRPIYLISFILFLLIFLGYPLAGSIFGTAFVRLLHGASWGAFSSSATTIAIDLIPPTRRGEGIGIYGLSMTIAMALGPLIATTILNNGSYLYCFIAAITFCLFGLFFGFNVKVPEHDSETRPSSGKHFFTPTALPPSLTILIVMLPYGGLLSFIGLYGQEINAPSIGLFYLILSVGIALSRVVSGKVFDLLGPFRISWGGMLLLIIGYILIALIALPIGYYVSGILLGLGFGIMMPTMQAMANHNLSMSQRGAANSTYLTGLDMGIGLGMMLYGVGIKYLGYSGVFLLSSVAIFFALLLFNVYVYPYYKK